ncbi:hypothetical protein BN3658_01805 [Coriobacteriaceae bacterium CHKCI002]|mgnify:FL=1|nr:hypothetical protein B5F41_07095 [Gordonibacter sp. An232A]CVH79144.1 hypothetical protein BN3658_01805 [Coriobacteriaceae bacterium CHKCI002]
MKRRSNISALEELAASEAGVFTAAQARLRGIPRYALAYAEKTGKTERIAHGAYRLSSSIDDGLDGLRAAYKLTAPETWTHERIRSFDGFAATGATAAHIHGIGNFHPDPYEIAAPRRFNSRMEGVRFPIRFLSEADIVWKSGIPVTRVEATIASLVDSDEDASLVADAFVEAIRKYGTVDMDIRELRKQLGADRYDKLLRAAGIAPFGEAKLVETDGMGHVALIEKKEG